MSDASDNLQQDHLRYAAQIRFFFATRQQTDLRNNRSMHALRDQWLSLQGYEGLL
jgi:hypothetical protein